MLPPAQVAMKTPNFFDPSKKEYVVPLNDQTETGVRANPGAIGFYRVHYEKSMMVPILQAITDGCVPEPDRLSILDDQFALVGLNLEVAG